MTRRYDYLRDVTVNEADGTATVVATLDVASSRWRHRRCCPDRHVTADGSDFTIGTRRRRSPSMELLARWSNIVVSITRRSMVVEDTETLTVSLNNVVAAGDLTASDTATGHNRRQ